MNTMFTISASSSMIWDNLSKSLKTEKFMMLDKSKFLTLIIDIINNRFQFKIVSGIDVQDSCLSIGDKDVDVKVSEKVTNISEAFVANFVNKTYVSTYADHNTTPYNAYTVIIKIVLKKNIDIVLNKTCMDGSSSSYQIGKDNCPDIICVDNVKGEYLIVLCPGDMLELKHKFIRAQIINFAYMVKDSDFEEKNLKYFKLKIMFKDDYIKYNGVRRYLHCKYIEEFQEKII